MPKDKPKRDDPKREKKASPNYPDSPEELVRAIFQDADRKLDEKLKAQVQRP